jgi:eukaryotic-like serine/threonine-protein kinase
VSPLGADRWRAMSSLLDRALELPDAERAAWIGALRVEDPKLADELQSLLDEGRAAERERFLEGGALSAPRSVSLAGQNVGPYTLIAPIGEGGMGSVWRARRSDGRFEGTVAVKLLSAHLIGRTGEQRFKREGSILARLTHPHIARLADAGIASFGQPYLVLEHVAGEPIDQYCDARDLDLEARLRLLLDVLEAVSYAHAHLVVHRDIKPSNVLVSTDGPTAGQVKLLDFGIAKLLEEDTASGEATALTREAGRAMTPEYASPEQVVGEPTTVATDVYSLGVLLYLLLTGRHPATPATRSPADLVTAIVRTEPPRPSAAVVDDRTEAAPTAAERAARRAATPERLRRQLRGDLDTIVATALKKRPDERYASVSALADDLRRYLERRPIRARPDALAYRAAKLVRRHALAASAAAAVTLVLAALVTFYTVRLAAERDRARLEAGKSATVSALLSDLLTAGDPYASGQREPTVREVLDAGAERFSDELAQQPEILAEMLTVLGRVYQRLGAYDRAQPLLEEALAVWRRLGGPDHERVAQSLNDLGVLLGERGEYAAAEPYLQQALEMRRRLLGEEHEQVAVTLVELGRVYTDQGLQERAEPLFREALAVRRGVFGDEHRETATSKSDLGQLLRRKGDLAGAERLLRETLATTRNLLGEEHPDFGTSLANVALVLSDRGDHAGAEAMLRQALAVNRDALGPSHPDIAAKLNSIADPLREQGKREEAAQAVEEALAIARPTLGDDHPLVARYLISLARVRLAQGSADAAEPLLRQALDIQRRALPEGDWRMGAAASLLGASLTAQGRYDEAERSLLEAREVLHDVPGGQGAEAEANRVRLAELYEAWGRGDDAQVYRPAPPATSSP